MNWVDAALLVIVVIAMWAGWQKGFILGIVDLIVWIGSLLAGFFCYKFLGDFFQKSISFFRCVDLTIGLSCYHHSCTHFTFFYFQPLFKTYVCRSTSSRRKSCTGAAARLYKWSFVCYCCCCFVISASLIQYHICSNEKQSAGSQNGRRCRVAGS